MAALVLGALLAGVPAEPAVERSGTKTPTPVRPASGHGVRPVRVLLIADAARIRISAAGPVTVREGEGAALRRIGAESPTILESVAGGALRIGGSESPAAEIVLVPEAPPGVRLSTETGGRWSAEATYPGTLRVRATEDGLTVVNHVDVERYVAGVVAREVWPTFHTEALRGQAIAARTYVLYHMQRRNEAAFDLSATQAAQVYRGLRDDDLGRRARQAAEDTRGLVLTYRDESGEDRLFCAYYSAACGGASQSAALFGAASDVPPLRGGVACDHCRIAAGDAYRWGPVRIAADEVLSQLVSRYPDFSELERITAIEAVEKTPHGRPVTLRIVGAGGESRELLAERFRLAVDGSRIKSTDFDIRVRGKSVVIGNGKGSGHGLGLCQWGMQGQALAGRTAGRILRDYYPGARLTRVY